MKFPVIIQPQFWVFLLLLSGSQGLAQNFVSNQLIDSLPISKNPIAQIVDVNEDGRLDVFLRGRGADGLIQTFVVHRVPAMDTIVNDSFQLMAIDLDPTHRGIFEFSDLNNDNLLDLVISGQDTMENVKTTIYHGLPGFGFQAPDSVSAINASMLAVADLNNNGFKEIIMSGQDSLGNIIFRILTKEAGNYIAMDSLGLPGLINGEMIVFDFDNNGADDIFYYGHDRQDVFQTLYFKNEGNFIFTSCETGIPGILNGGAAVGDFDYDGKADLVLNGSSKGGDTLTAVYLNRDTIFEPAFLNLTQLIANDLLMADLNGDGAVELVFNGRDTSGISANYAYINDGENILTQVDTMLPEGLNLSQHFGDFFRDGNLDAVQLKQDEEKWQLEFFRNINLPFNSRPQPPVDIFTINTYEDVKIIWSDPIDPTTPASSISCDLFIGTQVGAVDLVAPGFTYDDEKRLLVSNGNQGYRRITSRTGLPASIYYYGIQAVDNSYHAGPDFDNSPGGPGGPGGGPKIDSFIVCNDLVDSTIVACEGSVLTLSVPGGGTAGWYSNDQGYLGVKPNLFYSVGDSDSIFYAVVNSLECAEHGVYIIESFPSSSVDILSDTELCFGDEIEFTYPGVHDSLFWEISSTGEIFTTPTIDYVALETDVISLTVHDGLCIYNDGMNVDVSEIDLEVVGDSYEIVLGESVQLEASGAVFYKWSPAEGLDDVNIANPVATPNVTTTYTVTGTNNDDCQDSTTVLIIVNTLSFAPTLFTPNNDGRNDQFKLYGPTHEGNINFKFRIFNRAGLTVYETDSYSDAQNIGWDGNFSGKEQPPGIYYWKVSGIKVNGEPLLINEKDRGVLHLLR